MNFIKKNIFTKVLKSEPQNEQDKSKNGKMEIIIEKNEKPGGIEEKPKKVEENQRTMAEIVKDINNYFTYSSVPNYFDSENSPKERTSTNKNKIMNHLHRDDKQKIEEIEVPEPARHSTNIRPQVICEPRKSVKELLQLNEARLKLIKEEKEEQERRNSIKQKKQRILIDRYSK